MGRQAVLTTLARRARTGVLRFVSPIDALLRLALGRRRLPPLWLRRHTGALSAFESAASEMTRFLDRLKLLDGARLVLDVGCGAGAMVEELARRLPTDGRYVGFDVHAPSIAWCRKRWACDARLHFELARVASAYGSAWGAPASTYRFPAADGEADLVLAKSVLTHLPGEDARHYLSETRRVLRPGRAAVVTAFLYEAASPLARSVFPFPAADGARLRSAARPTAAVAWERSRFIGMIEDAGLHLQWHSEGFFPGRDRLTAQDVLLLGH